MAKGSYYVNTNTKSTSSSDNSYRSCICALIVFIFLSLFTIFFCYFLLPYIRSSRNSEVEYAKGIFASHEGDKPLNTEDSNEAVHTTKDYKTGSDKWKLFVPLTTKQIFTLPVTESTRLNITISSEKDNSSLISKNVKNEFVTWKALTQSTTKEMFASPITLGSTAHTLIYKQDSPTHVGINEGKSITKDDRWQLLNTFSTTGTYKPPITLIPDIQQTSDFETQGGINNSYTSGNDVESNSENLNNTVSKESSYSLYATPSPKIQQDIITDDVYVTERNVNLPESSTISVQNNSIGWKLSDVGIDEIMATGTDAQYNSISDDKEDSDKGTFTQKDVNSSDSSREIVENNSEERKLHDNNGEKNPSTISTILRVHTQQNHIIDTEASITERNTISVESSTMKSLKFSIERNSLSNVGDEDIFMRPTTIWSNTQQRDIQTTPLPIEFETKGHGTNFLTYINTAYSMKNTAAYRSNTEVPEFNSESSEGWLLDRKLLGSNEENIAITDKAFELFGSVASSEGRSHTVPDTLLELREGVETDSTIELSETKVNNTNSSESEGISFKPPHNFEDHNPTRTPGYKDESIHRYTTSGHTSKPEHIFNSTGNKVSSTIFPLCNSSHSEKKNLCETNDCKLSAGRMLSLIDYNTDPCEDMYQFSCGNPSMNSFVDPDMSTADTDKILLGKINSMDLMSSDLDKGFKLFYESCISYYDRTTKSERIKKAREVFKAIGDVSILKPTPLSLTQLIVQLILHGSPFLFDIDMDINSKNSSVYDIVLRSPKSVPLFMSYNYKAEQCQKIFKNIRYSSVDLNIYYKDYISCMDDYADYINSVQTAITELGFFEYVIPKKTVWAIQNIRVIVEWGILSPLKKLPVKSHQAFLLGSREVKEMNITTLQRTFPLIQWESLLTELFQHSINSDTVVQVYFEAGFKEMFDEMQKYEEEDLKVALRAMFAENIYREVVMEKKCSLESYCIKMSKYLLPDITSMLYLSTFTQKDFNLIESQILEIKNELVEVMKHEIMKDEWYSEDSKVNIYSKLNSLQVPLPVSLEHEINESFMDFPLADDYFTNIIQMLKRLSYLKYSILDRSPHNPRNLWFTHLLPYSASATFVHGVNAIMIPLAVSKILIDDNVPSDIAKKTMRQTVARGIAHSLDNTGILYQSDKKDHLLINDDMLTFNENVNSIGAVIYSNEMEISSKATNYKFKLEPNMSINARIADITAAKLVYLLMRNHDHRELPYLWGDFSIEQTYFITLAQMFCTKKPLEEYTRIMFEELSLPPLLRVANIATNSLEFAKAFDCPLGSRMNPEIKFAQYPWTE